MRQATLKLKSYASSVNIVDNGNLQEKILHIMFLTLSILAFFYVLLLGNVVFNIVERKSFEKEALALSSEVAGLELEYLSLSKKIDLSLARSLGFREAPTKKFTTRKAPSSAEIAKNEI